MVTALQVIIVLGQVISVVLSQEVPESPCPLRFHYKTKNSQPYGYINFLIKKPVPEVHVKVRFSIPGGAEDIGRLRFLGDKAVKLKNGKTARKLKYKIKFPDVTYLPLLVLLEVNGKTHCSGPKYPAPEFTDREYAIRKDTLYNSKLDGSDDSVDTSEDVSTRVKVPTESTPSVYGDLDEIHPKKKTKPRTGTPIYGDLDEIQGSSEIESRPKTKARKTKRKKTPKYAASADFDDTYDSKIESSPTTKTRKIKRKKTPKYGDFDDFNDSKIESSPTTKTRKIKRKNTPKYGDFDDINDSTADVETEREDEEENNSELKDDDEEVNKEPTTSYDDEDTIEDDEDPRNTSQELPDEGEEKEPELDDDQPSTTEQIRGSITERARPASIVPTTVPTPVECGVIDKLHAELVFGGFEYNRGEWPWVVALYTRNKNKELGYTCAGTLISKLHVITAAHCVKRVSTTIANTDIVVRMGCHDLGTWGDGSEFRSVTSTEFISSYDPTKSLEHDIMALTMNKEVTFTSFIRPVCLWNEDTTLQRIIGTTGIVAGWGLTENNDAGQGTPKAVRVPVVSTETCRASKVDYFSLTWNTTFCAGDRNGTGPCVGDSGGGMYVLNNGHWTLRGVVSLSLKPRTADMRCNLNEYVVFTDVAKYMSWIEGVISPKILPVP